MERNSLGIQKSPSHVLCFHERGLEINIQPNKSVSIHGTYTAWAEDHKNMSITMRLFLELQTQLISPEYVGLPVFASQYKTIYRRFVSEFSSHMICPAKAAQGSSGAAPDRLLPLLGASAVTNATAETSGLGWALGARQHNKGHL